MSKTIYRSIDVEDAIRSALDPYMEAYGRPLPGKFSVPCVLVQGTGGDTEAAASGKGKVDSFVVTHKTPFGEVRAGWRRVGGKVEYVCEAPNGIEVEKIQ